MPITFGKPASAEAKPGLFGKSAKKDAAPAESPEVIEQINLLSRRMRLIEDHTDNARRKMQLNEENHLKNTRLITTEVKTINEEMTELRHEIDDIKRTLTMIIKEVGLCAKKDKVAVLTRYIDMWEPIKFVTRTEVERIIRDIMQEGPLPPAPIYPEREEAKTERRQSS